MRDRGEGLGKEQPGKRKLQQEIRNLQKLRIVVESRAKGLQTAEVVREAEPRAPLLEDIPVAFARRSAKGLLQLRPELCAEAVIVEKRVVDIEQKDHLGAQHGTEVSRVGLCQVSSPPITRSASAGPQVPGSY